MYIYCQKIPKKEIYIVYFNRLVEMVKRCIDYILLCV